MSISAKKTKKLMLLALQTFCEYFTDGKTRAYKKI